MELLNKEINIQKIFKLFFRTLSLAAKKGYPQESRPCVSRPPAADSLAGHMIAGTARTRTFGRSDSVPFVSALMHPSRLRYDGDVKPKTRKPVNPKPNIVAALRRGRDGPVSVMPHLMRHPVLGFYVLKALATRSIRHIRPIRPIGLITPGRCRGDRPVALRSQGFTFSALSSRTACSSSAA